MGKGLLGLLAAFDHPNPVVRGLAYVVLLPFAAFTGFMVWVRPETMIPVLAVYTLVVCWPGEKIEEWRFRRAYTKARKDDGAA